MLLQAKNMDEIQRSRVQEITDVSFQLFHLRAQLIYSPRQAYTIPFALGELPWYLQRSDLIGSVSFYNPRYKCFSDDRFTLYGVIRGIAHV